MCAWYTHLPIRIGISTWRSKKNSELCDGKLERRWDLVWVRTSSPFRCFHLPLLNSFIRAMLHRQPNECDQDILHGLFFFWKYRLSAQNLFGLYNDSLETTAELDDVIETVLEDINTDKLNALYGWWTDLYPLRHSPILVLTNPKFVKVQTISWGLSCLKFQALAIHHDWTEESLLHGTCTWNMPDFGDGEYSRQVEVLQHSLAWLLPIMLLEPFGRFIIQIFFATGNIYMPDIRKTLRVRVLRLDEFPFFIPHMNV